MPDPAIIFENDEVVVVDKPSGMIVHPDEKHDYPALTSWLAERYGEGNYYLVHRIDRETSGVLIVAKIEAAYAYLKEQFQERLVRKAYRAFVYGTKTNGGDATTTDAGRPVILGNWLGLRFF
jgi:23S rRNA-/tRNA-specific pseudouridylate synthase